MPESIFYLENFPLKIVGGLEPKSFKKLPGKIEKPKFSLKAKFKRK
jgi:hypothetical protein